jgi:AcrR family transcriptional regulator
MSVDRVTTGVTQRMPRAERREQIARAAATVFMRGGFDGTSMDDVARQAGVTRLIVYRIFESKDELYRSVLDLVIDDLAASFSAIGHAPNGEPGRASDDYEHSIAGMVLGVGRRHPDAFRLLWRHAAHEPPFREVATLFKSTVTEYAIQLMGASFLDPLMRRWAAESVVSHLYESVCLWLDDGDPARDLECAAMITESVRSMVSRWIERGRVPAN